MAAAKGAGALLWAAGVLAVVAAGGAAWWLSRPADTAKEVQAGSSGARGALAEAERPGAVEAPDMRSATWDFTEKPPEGVKAIMGTWTWKKPAVTQRGYMEAQESVFAILPFKTRARPMVIEVDVTIHNLGTRASFGAYWIKEQPDRYIHLQREVFKQEAELRTIEIKEQHYVFGRYIVNLVGGQVSYCSRYTEDYPGEYLVVSCGNSKVHRITLREIEPEEIPEVWRDPEKLIPTLTKEYRSYPDQKLMKPQ